MNPPYFSAVLLAFLGTALLTPLVALVARRWGAVDQPGGRRIHRHPTARLGGVAVMAGFFIAFLVFLPDLAPHFKSKQLLGFSLAGLFLLIVGIVDDKRGVPPFWQLVSHAVAGLAIVLVGMGIEQVANPFGGVIALDWLKIAVPVGGVDHFLNLPADLLTVFWVILVINAVNWLDGLDGLATGVGGLSAGVIALLSVSAAVAQPHVALFALLLAGSLAGFLVYNWHPARIFLGTVGSSFIGFTLAVLAMISGGKVATSLIVLGVPILDAITLIVRRLLVGSVPWRADTNHLHHRLLAVGFSVRQTVLFMYGLTVVFGTLALLAGTTGSKAYVFAALIVFLAILFWSLARAARRRSRKSIS